MRRRRVAVGGSGLVSGRRGRRSNVARHAQPRDATGVRRARTRRRSESDAVRTFIRLMGPRARQSPGVAGRQGRAGRHPAPPAAVPSVAHYFLPGKTVMW